MRPSRCAGAWRRAGRTACPCRSSTSPTRTCCAVGRTVGGGSRAAICAGPRPRPPSGDQRAWPSAAIRRSAAVDQPVDPGVQVLVAPLVATEADVVVGHGAEATVDLEAGHEVLLAGDLGVEQAAGFGGGEGLVALDGLA